MAYIHLLDFVRIFLAMTGNNYDENDLLKR
jgi:hypothetical protein